MGQSTTNLGVGWILCRWFLWFLKFVSGVIPPGVWKSVLPPYRGGNRFIRYHKIQRCWIIHQWIMKLLDSFDAQRSSLKICFNRFCGCVFKLFFQAKWLLIDPKFTKANAMVTATAAPTSLPAQRVVRPVPQRPRRPRVLQRNLLARSMGIQIPPRSRVCRNVFFLQFFLGEPKNKHQKTRCEGEILKHGWEVFYFKSKLTNFLNKKDPDKWSSNQSFYGWLWPFSFTLQGISCLRWLYTDIGGNLTVTDSKSAWSAGWCWHRCATWEILFRSYKYFDGFWMHFDACGSISWCVRMNVLQATWCMD